MKKTSFDLDYLKHKRRDSENPWRRIAIFAVLAAAVGAGIYFLIPRDGAEDPVSPMPSAGELPSDDNQALLQPVTAENSASVDLGGTAVVSADPQVESPVESTPLEAADPQIIPQETAETPLPVKGIPHPTDPENDEPVIAPDALEPGGFSSESAAIAALVDTDPKAAKQRAERYLTKLSFSSEQWRNVAKSLTAANIKLLSQEGSSGAGTLTHTIRPGDSLSRIAAKYKITIAELRHLNGIAPDNDLLYVGKTLKVPGGTSRWSLEVSRRTRLLKVLNHRKLFAVYDIGVGRIGKDTPEGNFLISEKIKDPDYTAPDGKILSAGEAGNQLGSRWMRLAPVNGGDAMQGYGIHGTPDESTVAQSLSNGCIRMRKADVEMLFEIIPIGTPVTIEE